MIETAEKTHTRHHRIRRGALHAPIDAPQMHEWFDAHFTGHYDLQPEPPSPPFDSFAGL